MYYLRSGVHAQAPLEPVELPRAEDSTKYIRLDDLIKSNIPSVEDGTWFWNHPLMGNGALQTMYAAAGKFEDVDQIYYGRRLMTWEDGAQVSIDYHIEAPSSLNEWKEQLEYEPVPDLPPYPIRTRYLTSEEIESLDDPTITRPLVISLHGLTGGSHESYVRCTISALRRRGFDNLVLTSRGCNRTKITTPQLFCGIMTEDIRRLVKFVRKTQPNRKVYLVGYSLGASILGNYLGQEGENIDVDGACCVANPWDLHLSGMALHQSFMGRNVYSPAMTKNLLRVVKNHKEMLEEHPVFIKAQSAARPKFIYEFDDLYTAPFFGFDCASDYYRLGSSVHKLTSIRTPTLILNSADDPIVTKDCIPYAEAKRNPYTYLVTTDIGGHLGWFLPGGHRWFANVIADYFSTLFDVVGDFRKAKADIALPPRKWHVNELQL